MDEYLEFARKLAYKSGERILKGFGKPQSVTTKTDNSPVTVVDKDVNDLVIQSIQESYPEHGLLGEEANLGTGEEVCKWLCDPIDGTIPFILGIPSSVFMLALLKDGIPILSAVYNPHSDELYHALKGGGAFCNNKPIQTNNDSVNTGYLLLGTESYPYVQALKARGGRSEPVSGTGYIGMLIASGNGIGLIKQESDNHDIGPASLIVEEAGGRVTDFDGNRLRFDMPIGGVILSNGTAHNELLEIAQSTGGQ